MEPSEGYDWDAVLCYIDGRWAYFTTQDLKKQWGDDWNDAPYEHNAETPYLPHGDEEGNWKVYEIGWIGPFDTPCENHFNSPYSVEMINAGAAAWLTSDKYMGGDIVCIPAGVTLSEFKKAIESKGGYVYLAAKKGEVK